MSKVRVVLIQMLSVSVFDKMNLDHKGYLSGEIQFLYFQQLSIIQSMVKPIKKSLIRAIQGAIAALGAPFGWLVIRYLQGVDLLVEINLNSGLYFYMLFGTIAAFSLFGWYVGSKEQFIELVSLRDPLTGLYNVRYFRKRLEEEVIEAHRHQSPLSLIYFDLDHFKRVNDSYGHSVGDEVLIAVSRAASDVLRQHEVLARVGGEEFVGLLPRCTKADAKITAERLRTEIAATAVKIDRGKNIAVTVSLGVADLAETDDSKTLYAKADSALYQAKARGRNRVHVI